MYPQILHIYGPFWITSYGLCIVLGLTAFIGAAFYHKNRRRYIGDEQLLDVATWGILGGLLGGKVLYLLQEATFTVLSFQDFIAHVLGGFAIMGAIIGAFASVILYLWWYELPIREVLDIAGTYALLAHGIARFGCFLAGCCYGAVCATTCIAVTYTHHASLAPLHMPLYPTQLFMAGASLLGFLLMRFVIYPWRGRPLGAVIAWYIMFEAASRLVIDYWRGDRVLAADPLRVITDKTFSWWPLSFHQHVALLLVCAAGTALVLLHSYSSRGR